ncbi:hypothetical protein CL643_00720 [bacterium]|nr:hypothetical protein [bacterium]MBT01619.1 hypothetical protein [bacterium]
MRRIFEKFLLYLAMFLVRVVPFQHGETLGKLYFSLLWPLMISPRKRAIQRMRLVFVDVSISECEKILKKSFYNLALTMVEIFYMHLHGKDFFKLIKLKKSGFKNIKSIKKGGIMVTAHYGNWEICGAFFKKNLDIPLIAVGRAQSNSLLNDLALETRSKFGMLNLTRHWRDLAKISKIMKKGAVAGLVSDQHSANGIVVDFMGRPARAFTGAYNLSLKFDCSAVVSIVRRVEWGSFEWVIRPSKKLGKLSQEEAVQQYSNEIVELIMEEPSQWLWLHNRWKVG